MERMLYDLREAIAAATRGQPRARGPFVPDGPLSVLAVVAGQGGNGSLEAFLGGLPAEHPPVVVGHPTPTGFLPKFLARLQKACGTDVAVAASGSGRGRFAWRRRVRTCSSARSEARCCTRWRNRRR
jgi:chemotaxis response regulator CheB